MVLVEITEEVLDMKLPKGNKHIDLSLLRKCLSHINHYINNLVLGTHMISNTHHTLKILMQNQSSTITLETLTKKDPKEMGTQGENNLCYRCL